MSRYNVTITVDVKDVTDEKNVTEFFNTVTTYSDVPTEGLLKIQEELLAASGRMHSFGKEAAVKKLQAAK